MEKNFKVTYGKGPKTNKWGYFLPKDQQPPTFERYFSNYNDALQFASEMGRLHKKWSVCMYDLNGPLLDEEATVWLVVSFEKGNPIFNSNYTEALERKSH